jgi:hypothetical protein
VTEFEVAGLVSVVVATVTEAGDVDGFVTPERTTVIWSPALHVKLLPGVTVSSLSLLLSEKEGEETASPDVLSTTETTSELVLKAPASEPIMILLAVLVPAVVALKETVYCTPVALSDEFVSDKETAETEVAEPTENGADVNDDCAYAVPPTARTAPRPPTVRAAAPAIPIKRRYLEE